jgi:glycosyltransferase involved in cell wall biosynthesis
MARIGIDARKYFDFGIGTYIQRLIESLHQLQIPHSVTLFVSPADRANLQLPSGVNTIETRYGKYSWGEFASYGSDIRKQKIDLFHEPHYTLPRGLNGRSVVTIHDMIHLKFPEFFSTAQRLYASFMIRYAVNNAGAVIAVSQKSKDDLAERFRIDEKRIHVIHNGIGKEFRRILDADILRRFRKSRGLERPFVLYVGGLRPHKNIPVLLKAFTMLRQSKRDLELVFAGDRILENPDLSGLARESGILGLIRDLGRVNGEELVALYNCAEMVVLPSLYEGFGFPALEAMACETAAVVSNKGSLPEVVGEGAAIFEAEQAESLAEVMKRLFDDSEYRRRLCSRGRSQAARFTWDECARKTMAVYDSMLS